MRNRGLKRRAQRALDRQLSYQRAMALRERGDEAQIMAAMAEGSRLAHAKISAVRPVPADARVLEVGSGAHGLIFFFAAKDRIGLDPLADHYRDLYPAWQDRAQTIAAFGEALPFADSSFDVVLSDNVVDHAERPEKIVEEMARVLKPGGLLYFTVNIHHPLYDLASRIHAAWRAMGIKFEVTPFADHTVHFTRQAALCLFQGQPFSLERVSDTIEETRDWVRTQPARHVGDRLKRWFFKNAQLEVIAVRSP